MLYKKAERITACLPQTEFATRLELRVLTPRFLRGVFVWTIMIGGAAAPPNGVGDTAPVA